jgi:hypothetical protein
VTEWPAAALLSRAQDQIEGGHIILPIGDNALGSCRGLATLIPNSPDAGRLVQQIRLGLQAGARDALAAGNGDEAERLYALAADPEGDADSSREARLRRGRACTNFATSCLPKMT